MALLSRKERGALLPHKELLGKGDDAETPLRVPVKGKSEAWMSDIQLKGKVLTEYQYGRTYPKTRSIRKGQTDKHMHGETVEQQWRPY